MVDCILNTVYLQMLIASVAFAISGVAIHGLGQGGWDLALLSRALFGLPFALGIYLGHSRKQALWIHRAILLRSVSAVAFLALLYFILQNYSPGDAFTLASMRPLWVAGLGMVIGFSKVRFVFWPLAATAVVGVSCLEGNQFASGPEFYCIALVLGLLGGASTLAVDFCKNTDAAFLTLHLTVTMFVVSVFLVCFNGHISFAAQLLDNKLDLLLYSIAGLGGTLYQIFSIRVIKSIGSIGGSSISLLATLVAWFLGHLIWQSPSTAIGVLGIVLTLVPCIYLTSGRSLISQT